MTGFTLSSNSCSCNNGYISNNTCLSCVSNCLNCVSSSGCITCAPGYFISGSSVSNNTCLSCVSNCLICVSSSGCVTCAPGYFINGSLCSVQTLDCTFLVNNVDSIRYLRISSDYKTVYAFSDLSIRIYNLIDSGLTLKQTINTQLLLGNNYDQV